MDEPDKFVEWAKGTLEYVPAQAGPRRAGSTFRMRIQEGRRVAEYRGEVIAYEPPRRLGVRIGGGSFGDGAMRVEYGVEDLGGRTRLDYDARMELAGPLRLLGPLLSVFGRLHARRLLRRLKALAEAAGTPA